MPYSISEQIRWIIKQIQCIKDEKCCKFSDTALDYNAETGTLSATFANGEEQETTIEFPEFSFITANTDYPTAMNGSLVVQFNAKQISAYDQHLVFEEHQNGGGDLISVLKLSDAFLSTIDTSNVYAFSNLPSTPSIGKRAFIDDADNPIFLSVAVGGGSIMSPVFWNGSNWIIG